MNGKTPTIDIEPGVSVTAVQIEEAGRIEDNPEIIMRLVDLLFLCRDEHTLPS